MSEVSVPCAHCSAPITFRDEACPACRKGIPGPLRAALEARLEAADEDFRDMLSSVRSATILYAGHAAIIFFFARNASMAPEQRGAAAADALALGPDFVLAAAIFACFLWARRAPGPATGTALAFWIGVQAITALFAPLTIFQGVPFKLVILFLLGRGVLAALRASAVRKRLATRPRG
jgi:hypothetical protein